VIARQWRWLIVAAVLAIPAVVAVTIVSRRYSASGYEAPSNVRIVQSDVTGEQWIRWDDIDGEAGYRGSVRLVDGADGVVAVSDFNTPRPGEAQSPVTPFDSRYAEDGECYEGIVRVEAVMPDGTTRAAPELTLHICIENGMPRYRPFEYVPEALVFPEPAPGNVLAHVERSPAGQYSLAFDGASHDAEYLLTTSRVYTEQGVLVCEIAPTAAIAGNADSMHVDPGECLLPADPQSMPGGRPPGSYDACYRRDFITWTIDDGILGGWSAVSRLPVCYGDVVSTFPTIDNPEPIIPASASNVGIVRDSGGQWTITWDDNSDNETGFEILVSVQELDGETFVRSATTDRTSEYTTAGLPLDMASLGARCYRTTIYVFSERFDNASGLPGNTAFRMCVQNGDATFEPL
jgi:hypothetical protein